VNSNNQKTINSIRPGKRGILLAVFIAYIFISLIFFKDIFSKIYIDPTGDSFFSFYSWNTFFRNCIVKGIFPFWNPLVLCGHPYHLESVSNFSLANFLLLFFNVNTAWNVKIFFSAVMSGWLMFFLLHKQVKLSIAAAFIGGLAYMFLMPDVFDNPPLFLPLAFILANKWIEKEKFLWAFLLAATLSVYFFNANPQFVLYSYALIYIYIIFMFIRARKENSSGKITSLLITGALPFIIACGLSLLRILPMFEMLKLSHRSSMSTFSFMLSPTHLINVIYPKFFMSSANPQFNFFPDEVLNGIVSSVFGSEFIKFTSGPYVGVLPFILALTVIIKRNKIYIEKFFTAAALTVLLYVTLNALFYPIIAHIPILNKMPFISRSYLIYNFSMAILAGLGMENLLKNAALKTKNILRFIFILVLFIVFFRAAAQIILVLFGQDILMFLTKNVLPFITKQASFRASSEFYSGRLHDLIVFFKSWSASSNIYFIFPTIFLLASLAAIGLYIKNKASGRILIGACIIIIFIDAYYNFSLPVFAKNKVVTCYGSADFINKQPGVFRVMPLLQNYDEKNPSPMEVRTFLQPESNMAYGIMTPEGYRSLILDRYAEVMAGLTYQSSSDIKAKLGEFHKIDRKIANLLNIKYIVTFPGNNNPEVGYEAVYKDGVHKVLLNKDALPRAFLVHNVKIIKSKEQALRELNSGFDFSSAVMLEEDVDSLKPSGKSFAPDVSIEKYEPNRIDISVNNPRDGFLVLLDCYYPGWKAFVDDKPAKIMRANYIFRAVRIAPGRHMVKFLYASQSLKTGFILSAIFFMSGIILCIVLRKK